MRGNWSSKTAIGLSMLALTFLLPWTTSTWKWFDTYGDVLTGINVKVPFPWPFFLAMRDKQIQWAYTGLQAGAIAFLTGVSIVGNVASLSPELKRVLRVGLLLLATTLLLPWCTYRNFNYQEEGGGLPSYSCPWPFFLDSKREQVRWDYVALQAGAIVALTGAVALKDLPRPSA